MLLINKEENFQVLTVVEMRMLSFGIVTTPCRHVGRYQRFEQTCCVYFQG